MENKRKKIKDSNFQFLAAEQIYNRFQNSKQNSDYNGVSRLWSYKNYVPDFELIIVKNLFNTKGAPQ